MHSNVVQFRLRHFHVHQTHSNHGFSFLMHLSHLATVLKRENNFSRFSNSFHFTEKNLKRGNDVVLQAKAGLPLSESKFWIFIFRKKGVIWVRVMRPTFKDANFHFSYAHSAIFSLPLQKKLKEGSISFHRRNLNFLAFGYRKFFFANYNWNNNGSWVPCMGLMGACNRSWSALKVSTISDLFFLFCLIAFWKVFS